MIVDPSAADLPSVLCRTLGAHRERSPPPALEAHFARTWFHVCPSDASAEPMAVVPDGYADLQWIDGALRVAGPDRTANTEALPGGTIVVGLRFQPGAAGRWLDTSVRDLVASRAPLEAFWGAEARRMAATVGEGGSPEAIARRLEAALIDRASRVDAPNPAASAIFRAVRLARGPVASTRGLSESLGMSARTVRRHAVESFGYGPKTLQRILRFRGFLRAARAAASRSLAELAAATGYADQAHLSREARELTGMTPAVILTRLP